MRRLTAVLAAASLGVSGCSFSKVDPDADVTVAGRALDAAGRPLADTEVLLFKQADVGEVLFGSILAVGTLSTVCFLPDPPGICEKGRSARTDADGHYEFRLTGDDTQGTLGTASTLNVVFAGKPGSTTVSFVAEDADVELPDAALWNARPRATSGRGALGLSWTGLPSGEAEHAEYSVQLYESRDGAALWVQGADGTSGEVDGRILESRRGFLAAGATTKSSGSGASDVRIIHQSTQVPVTSSAGVPPSRGKRCAAVTGTGRVRTGPWSRCGATDGNLSAPARLAAGGTGTVTGVVVDLGSRRKVGLAVARGFAGQLLLEVSDDGTTYRVVATGSGSAVGLTPNAPTTARYVRLRSPSGLEESLGSELSVWG